MAKIKPLNFFDDLTRATDMIGPLGEVVNGLSGKAEQLSTAQVNLESGNRQFDKNGKTLVGRRSDGSLPKESERAYGKSQSQIRTARNTALKHGIEWDEQKFMNDGDYNLMLGHRHKRDLQDYYKGDETLAIAAYHSGQPNVDRALRKYGRANFTKGLGPDGRDYVKKLTGEGEGRKGVDYSQTQGANGMPRSINLDPAAATPEELARMQNTKYQPEIANLFELAPQAQEAVQNSINQSQVLTDVVDALQPVVEGAQQTRMTETLDQQNEKARLISEMQNRTRQNTENLQPLLMERVAIQNRRNELRKMNPFERFFKSLVDPKYDSEHLLREGLANETQIETLLDNQKILDFQSRQLLQLENEEFTNDTAVADESLQQTDRSYAWAVRASQAADNHVNNVLGGMRSQTDFDRMEETVKASELNLVSESALAVAEENAAASESGTTAVNGITFTAEELKIARMQKRDFRIQTQIRDQAAERGNIEVQEYAENKMIESSTPQQRADALKNGGILNGQKVPIDKLLTQVDKDNRVSQAVVSIQTAGDRVQSYRDASLQLAESIKNDTDRVNQLMGGPTGEFSEYVSDFSRMFGGHKSQIAAANGPNGGGTESIVDSLNKDIAKLAGDRDKALNSVALAWAGGNQQVARIAKGFLTNGKVSPLESTRVLMLQAQGKLPKGVDMSPANASSFGFVKRFIDTYTAETEAKGKKVNEAEMTTQLSKALATRRTKWLVNEGLKRLPVFAQDIKLSGQPHPMSRVSPEQFVGAVQAADSLGLEKFVTKYNLNLTDASAESAVKAAQAAGVANPAQSLIGIQMAELFGILDKQFSTSEFDASQAFADLVRTPELHNKLTELSRQQVNSNKFGDFLMNNAQGIGGQNELINRMDQYSQIYDTWLGNKFKAAAMDAKNRTFATDRVKAVLRGVEGISPEEATQLANALKLDAPGNRGEPVTNPNLLGQVLRVNADEEQRKFDAYSKIITFGKFDDPRLESIRKRAAKSFVDISTIYDRIRAEGNF